MKLRLFRFCAILLLINLSSCIADDGVPSFSIDQIEGFAPIYESDLVIGVEKPSDIQKTGKILVYQDYLLINDVNRGVHVVDNSDKRNPKKLFFISIPSNNDMAMKNGLLYVDNGPDLVVLSFDDSKVIEIAREKEVFF
ncbi:MAG: hypothetical protein AAFY41_07160, partial [Bacteroidota bacterium]